MKRRNDQWKGAESREEGEGPLTWLLQEGGWKPNFWVISLVRKACHTPPTCVWALISYLTKRSLRKLTVPESQAKLGFRSLCLTLCKEGARWGGPESGNQALWSAKVQQPPCPGHRAEGPGVPYTSMAQGDPRRELEQS